MTRINMLRNSTVPSIQQFNKCEKAECSAECEFFRNKCIRKGLHRLMFTPEDMAKRNNMPEEWPSSVRARNCTIECTDECEFFSDQCVRKGMYKRVFVPEMKEYFSLPLPITPEQSRASMKNMIESVRKHSDTIGEIFGEDEKQKALKYADDIDDSGILNPQ